MLALLGEGVLLRPRWEFTPASRGHALAACWLLQSPQAWQNLHLCPNKQSPLTLNSAHTSPGHLHCFGAEDQSCRPLPHLPLGSCPRGLGILWCGVRLGVAPHTDYCRLGPTSEEPCIKVYVESGPGFVARCCSVDVVVRVVRLPIEAAGWF